MSVIGTLEIQLLANIAKLQADMDKSKSVVSDAMKQIESSVNMAKQAFVAFTGVAGVNAFKGMILGVFEAGEKLNDLSIAAGISVEKLSGLASIGKFSGQSADSLASSMNKLSKNLASSNEDSKGAAAALKALGLNFDDFQKMTPDARMLKIATAMGEFQDGAQKSAAAMLLFGKTGAELLPFMKDLAEAGEIHTKVTAAQAAAADQFDDNLVRLKSNGDAWKKSLAYELLPTLNDLLDVLLTIKQSTSSQGSVIGEALKSGLQVVGVLAVNLNYVLRQMGNEIGGVIAQAVRLAHLDLSGAGAIGDQMKKDAEAARIEVDKLSSSLMGITNSRAGAGRGGSSSTDPRAFGVGGDGRAVLSNLNGNASGAVQPSDFDKINKQTIEQINLAAAALGASRDLTESEKARIKSLSEIDAGKLTAPEKALFKQRVESIAAMQDEIKARDHVAKAVEAENLEKEKAWKAAEDYSASLDKTLSDLAFETSLLGKDADAIRQMTALRKLDADAQRAVAAAKSDPAAQDLIKSQSAEAQQKVVAGMVQQKAAQDALNGSWTVGAKNALTEYQKTVSNVAAFTQTAFANAFKGMEDALVSFVTTGKLDFASLVNSMIADLVRYQVQQSIMKPLTAAMGPSGGIMSLLGFASGGQPPVGVPSIVGEKGPELFIPNTAGTIVPNHALGGGSNVTINVIEDSSKAGTQQQRQGSNGGSVIDVFVAQVKASIASDIASGNGAVSGAMQQTYGLNRVAGAY